MECSRTTINTCSFSRMKLLAIRPEGTVSLRHLWFQWNFRLLLLLILQNLAQKRPRMVNRRKLRQLQPSHRRCEEQNHLSVSNNKNTSNLKHQQMHWRQTQASTPPKSSHLRSRSRKPLSSKSPGSNPAAATEKFPPHNSQVVQITEIIQVIVMPRERLRTMDQSSPQSTPQSSEKVNRPRPRSN